MIATILAFLTALLNNLKGIKNIFRENPEATKARIEQENEQETRDREKGGRPKWN